MLEDADDAPADATTAAADEEEFNPTAIPVPAEEGAEIDPTVIAELEPYCRSRKSNSNYNHVYKYSLSYTNRTLEGSLVSRLQASIQ